jgi:hypothetical protein
LRFAFWTSALSVIGAIAFLVYLKPETFNDVYLVLGGLAAMLFLFGLPRGGRRH